MKRKSLAAAFLFVLLAASCAFAGAQDFVLINKTGVEIYAVYIAPSDSEDWEEDVLSVDTLPSGKSVKINFAPGTDVEYWDIRVEDSEGDALEWYEFNLLRISRITLLKNGDAEFE
jgi:hypothetical protein